MSDDAPHGWSVQPLRLLATLARGKFSARPRNNPKYYGGPYPFIQTGDVRSSAGEICRFSQTLNEAGLRVSKLFPAGTLFITIAANIGDLGVTRFACAAPDSVVAVKPTDAVDQRWLYYALRREKRVLESIATQNAQANLNLQKLLPFQLLVPSRSEQVAIARVLGDADALIAGLRRVLAKRQAIRQGLLQQLLTGTTRLPGFTEPWSVMALGAIGTFLKGRGVKRDDVRRTGIRCVRYGELYTAFQDYTTEAMSFVPPDVAESALPLKTGDVLFAGSGETREDIGKCIAYMGPTPAVAGGDVIVLRGDQCNPIYLALLANTPAVATQKARAGQGDTVVHIYSHALARIEVSLPHRAEQDAIVAMVVDVDREIGLLGQRLRKAENVKQGMMQELLTGRTRLLVEESAA